MTNNQFLLKTIPTSKQWR